MMRVSWVLTEGGTSVTLPGDGRTAAAAFDGLANALKPRIHSQPPLIEMTGIIKQGGPLTKRISLSPEDELFSDGSACVMSAGYAWSETFVTLAEFGAFIDNLPSNKAI